ncbi:MAG: fluoride efflux transporter CrcB [Acidobacteria bacterium]|jgi:CrcB protein|nr:fluoride efflux transporter CrcB [Acidobacteriota bacterium]|tara:strand:+ start:138 stop:500 length:363 start_codon:yes stop_codon:yes gene_type:complete
MLIKSPPRQAVSVDWTRATIQAVVNSGVVRQMAQIFFVGMGGFLGSVARYLMVSLVQGASGSSFPFGTLAVNVTGCVAIGGLSELLEAQPFMSGEARAFLVIGLLGGFTTFSAFGNETVN